MELSEAYNFLLTNPLGAFLVLPSGVVLDQAQTYVWINQQCGGPGGHPVSVYPGSFNPLHDGHRQIFDHITDTDGYGVKVFELSVSRWGKSPLELEDLSSRLLQFRGYAPVLVTNATRFIEKCGVLRHIHPVNWHVGVDTITRMRDDYGELGIYGLPGWFIVYDRQIGDKVEKYPLDFKFLPGNVRRSKFQVPDDLIAISSTKLRNMT